MKVNAEKLQGLLNFVAEQLSDKPTTLSIIKNLVSQLEEKEEAETDNG